MIQSRNLAARMGRWSARHRKKAIFGWLAFVVVAFALGTYAVGTRNLDPAETGVGESGRMDRLLHNELEEPAGEHVLIQSSTLTARSSEFRATIADVVRRVNTHEIVTNLRSPPWSSWPSA